MNGRCLTLLVLAMFAAACDSSVKGGDSGGGDSGGGDTTTPDLFACNVEIDCVLDYGHLGETVTDEALRCGGKLAASGEPGVMKTMSTPGPYPQTIETLYVVHGDGTVTVQTRSKCATDDACDGQSTSEWGRNALERCAISFDPATIEGCDDPQGKCEWYPKTSDCAPVEDAWTCADLAL